MNPEVKAILFDLGNVLFDLEIPKTWRAMESLFGVELEHTFNYPPTQELMYDYEKGLVDTGTFVGELQRLSKPGTTPKEVVNAWNAMLLEIPKERFGFLDQLKKHFPLYLLSNINTLHLEFFYRQIRDRYQILNWDTAYFEQTFYSHLIGMRKPDASIYQHVSKEINFPMEAIFFVDDNKQNIKTAAKLGMQTYLLGEKEEVMNLSFFQKYLNEI